jgi:hypothetical protein
MDRDSTLYSVNPGTGTATAVGPLGVGPVTGSAIDPSSLILYTGVGGGGKNPLPESGCIYRVDTATGAATQVGCDAVQHGNDPIPGLAFSGDGTLYGVRLASNAAPADGNLYLCRVNPANGALTDIGSIGAWGGCEGYGMDFGRDGLLYSWNNCDGLTTLDVTDASKAVIGGSFFGFPTSDDLRIPDMARDPAGQMWAIVVSGHPNAGNAVYYTARVDTASGDVNYVATLPANIQTLKFQKTGPVPTLGEWGMILLIAGIGLSAAYLLARRRPLAA